MNTALKALQLKARHQVYTLLSGHNLSKLHGEGYDFAELREYQVGDDIRKINWTITAKLGKPYIKELHASRELSVVVATLMDGSLYFGKAQAKQGKLTEVATLLGYATLQNADLFTGIAYTEEKTHTMAPSKQIFHLEQFSETLFEYPLLNTKLNQGKAIQDLFRRIHKPSLLFIVSDFLEPVDLSLLSQKHEVIAVIIRDREEELPRKLGEVTLVAPQSGEKRETYFGKRNMSQYREKLLEHEQAQQAHFARYDIRSVKIFTDEDPLPKLLKLFL